MNGEAKKEAMYGRINQLAQAGILTPDRVVEDARDPDSPLHDQFEWDDTVAAEAHRKNQARRLISSIVVTIIEEKRILQSIAYVRDPDQPSREQGYASVTELRTDEDRARRALLNELGTASAYLARVRALSVALGLDTTVEAIERDMAALKEKVGA